MFKENRLNPRNKFSMVENRLVYQNGLAEDLPIVPPVNTSRGDSGYGVMTVYGDIDPATGQRRSLSSGTGRMTPGMQAMLDAGGTPSIVNRPRTTGGVDTTGGTDTTGIFTNGAGYDDGTGYTNDFFTGGTDDGTGGESQDIYEILAGQQSDFYSGQEEAALADIERQRGISESNMASKLRAQQELLDIQFAPQYQRADENLDRTIVSANLGAAAPGSVRGSRQSERIVQLNQAGQDVKNAISAQKQAQLALYKAQLQGASDEVMKGLQNRLNGIIDSRREAETNLELAKEGAMAQQIESAGRLKEQQLKQLSEFYEAQGQAVHPVTGAIINSLEGDQMKADIAKTNASTLEIYGKTQDRNLDIEYFEDEMGNTTATIYNKSTGEFTVSNLGRLSTAQKWAVGGLGAASYGNAGVDPALGYDPTNTGILADIGYKKTQEGLTNSEAVAEVAGPLVPLAEREALLNEYIAFEEDMANNARMLDTERKINEWADNFTKNTFKADRRNIFRQMLSSDDPKEQRKLKTEWDNYRRNITEEKFERVRQAQVGNYMRVRNYMFGEDADMPPSKVSELTDTEAAEAGIKALFD